MEYRLTNGTSIEDVDGIAVLLKPCGGSAVLNETAALILDGLISDLSFVEVVASVTGNYIADDSTVIKDIHRVTNELISCGMIEKTGI